MPDTTNPTSTPTPDGKPSSFHQKWNDFVRASRSVPLSFVTGRGHYETVIRAVREAKTSVWIATANLKELMVEDLRWTSRRKRFGSTSYRSVIGVFAELAAQGVELRILHAAPPLVPQFRRRQRRIDRNDQCTYRQADRDVH